MTNQTTAIAARIANAGTPRLFDRDLGARTMRGAGWCEWQGVAAAIPAHPLRLRACASDAPGAVPVPVRSALPAADGLGMNPNRVQWVQVSEGDMDARTGAELPADAARALELLTEFGAYTAA